MVLSVRYQFSAATILELPPDYTYLTWLIRNWLWCFTIHKLILYDITYVIFLQNTCSLEGLARHFYRRLIIYLFIETTNWASGVIRLKECSTHKLHNEERHCVKSQCENNLIRCGIHNNWILSPPKGCDTTSPVVAQWCATLNKSTFCRPVERLSVLWAVCSSTSSPQSF